MKPNDYIEQRGEGWYIRHSRISLDSVVYAFRNGLSPEAIARECFAELSLEEVYGAITFYLAHRAEIDAYLAEWVERGEIWGSKQRAAEPEFAEKMAHARREFCARPHESSAASRCRFESANPSGCTPPGTRN